MANAAPFQLPPLPWDEGALAPTISARTIGLHYGKHHRTYVEKLNELVAGTRVEVPVAQNRSPGARLSRPLLMLSEVPAGEYRLVAVRTGGYVPGEFGQRSAIGLGISFYLSAGQQMRGFEPAYKGGRTAPAADLHG